MPNRFTRVPDGRPPDLPAGIPFRVITGLADAFMVAMISRPSTGSLRRTWVTPATLGLAGLTCVVGVLLCVVALDGALTGIGRVLGFAVAVALLLGSGSVFAIGLYQRGKRTAG